MAPGLRLIGVLVKKGRLDEEVVRSPSEGDHAPDAGTLEGRIRDLGDALAGIDQEHLLPDRPERHRAAIYQDHGCPSASLRCTVCWAVVSQGPTASPSRPRPSGRTWTCRRSCSVKAKQGIP